MTQKKVVSVQKILSNLHSCALFFTHNLILIYKKWVYYIPFGSFP